MEDVAVSAPAPLRAATQWPSVPRAPRIGLAERRALLMLGDLAVLNGAFFVLLTAGPSPAWLGPRPTPELLPEWFISLSLVWLVVGVLTDSFDLSAAGNRFTSPYRAVSAALITLVAYAFVPYYTPLVLKARVVWAAQVLGTLPLLVLWRFAYAALVGHPVLLHRAIVVGAGESGRMLAETLRRHTGSGYQTIGFVDDDAALAGATIAGYPVLGTTSDLRRLLESTGADELVVATTGPLPGPAYEAITAAYEAGVRVTPMIQLYEGLTGRIPVEHVGDHWLAVLPQPASAGASYAMAKRTMDVLGATVGLFAAALVCIPIAISIWIESGGPVFFSQTRLGKGGRPFRIYKFRSISTGHAEGEAQTIWERKATRPTRVGRLLRRLRLDELPQFWNVLKGEMSLVGPRPFVPAEVEELQRHIPFFRSRLLVRPGLTGWAQVKDGYGSTLADELTKLQYDLYYVRHQSIALDLIILLKTISVVLRLAGR